jgi:DNA repair photolyase
LIYRPVGAALEYAALALNLYTGCSHGCAYCFAPSAIHRERKDFHAEPRLKTGHLLDELEHEAARLEPSTPILMSFTTDPYQPLEDSKRITRDAIEILHRHGHAVQILTKGGTRALRDIDLFTKGDAFGTTLTFTRNEDHWLWEPAAAYPDDRIEALRSFHEAGIPTWVSLEPVIYPEQTLELIRQTHPFVDQFKLGKWNHDQRAKQIDWNKFAVEAVELLKSLGKEFVIKDALRPYLPADAN